MIRSARAVFASLAVMAWSVLPATAQSGSPHGAAEHPDGASLEDQHKKDAASAAAAGWTLAPVEEKEVSTPHSITADGRVMPYHATAGTLTIRDDAGKPIASVFYVAYTLDKSDARHRPVTFFYNGGPGSSSVWLHMGSFAPMNVKTANPEYIKPAPYSFGPNADTLLDKSDLIFVDAIGTGFSRPLGDTPGSKFWNTDGDADAFARAIMRYVTKNARWNSPKFLFGESYGTTRSAAVAYQLQDRGMALNGVILLSSILNYGIRQPGYDQSYISYLPSYAATAWYHNRLQNRPADLPSFIQEVRNFAAGPYAAALEKGQLLSPQEADTVARQMSAYTGLSPDFIKRANLRVDLERFQKELLRDQRLTVGRYDSRYTGVDVDAAGEGPDYDASDTAISGAFIATFSDYLQRDLNYKTDMPYAVEVYGDQNFHWDFAHKAPGSHWLQSNPDVAVDLSAAMRTNPYLKVMSLNGYYDMATPFFATEYDLDHMLLEPGLQRNLEFRYYQSGHMAYLNPDARHQIHEDLSRFYDEAVSEAQHAPPVRPGISSAGAAASTAPGSGGPNTR